MKSVLYIQPYASHVGGVDTVLLQLVVGLDKTKYKPYVMLPGPSPYVEKYKLAGAEVLFGKLAVFGKPTDWAYYIRNLIHLFISIRSIRRIVKRYDIDIIHSHKMELIGGNIAGKLAGIPTLQTVHELPRKPLIAYKFIGLLNHLFNDKVIILCERSKIMFQWGNRTSKKLHKIYNGIDVPVTDNETDGTMSLREELGLSPRDQIAITVARLTPMKGIEYLIKAANLIKKENANIKFVVVGDVAFDYEQGYKNQLINLLHAYQLEDTLFFLGLRRDVPRLLKQSDVFVLPSVYDIFPTVLLEAMCAELAIVATDVGGVPEMVKADIGLLIPPMDEEAIKSAVLEVLAGNREELGKNGYAYVLEHLTREKYVANTAAVYEELLGSF